MVRMFSYQWAGGKRGTIRRIRYHFVSGNCGSAVDFTYKPPFKFSGRI